MLKITDENLDYLEGVAARLWNFSPSHDRLAFEIKDPQSKEIKYLVFLGCERIEVGVLWNISKPIIKEVDVPRFKIEDRDVSISFEECWIVGDYTLEGLEKILGEGSC